MKALMVVAHGSRHPESDVEIRALVDSIRTVSNGYQKVVHAYLEIASPDIPDTLQSLASAGAENIDLLPYFLARGNHVARDVPEIVEEFLTRNDGININILPHIGAAPTMANYVMEHVSATT